MRPWILVAALSFAACTRESPPAPYASNPPAKKIPAAPPLSPANVSPPLPPQVPPQTRAADDLAPCPGINPDIRRPKGSNCLGVVPEACGADKARAFTGQRYDPAMTLARLEQAAGHRNIRITRFDQAVTDDLQSGRLNVVYSRENRISHIDCY